MTSKIGIWSGEEFEIPKLLHEGTLYALNDKWGITSIGCSQLEKSLENELKIMQMPGEIKESCCTDSSALIVLNNGELWGFSNGKNDSMIFRRETDDKVVKIDGLGDIIHAAIGKTHAAAVDQNGKLFTWGIGKYSQLGDLQSTQHGPIPVKSTEVFNVQQVLCGEKFTCIRTLGGYVYIFGMLGHSKSCQSPKANKQCPYTLPELETHFIASLSGHKFISVLTSEGKVFIFDACMELVNLSSDLQEISSIATSENSVFGLGNGLLYQWTKGEKNSQCALQNWNGKVYELEVNYAQCTLVSGFGKNIGILTGVVEGVIGKLIQKKANGAEKENFEKENPRFVDGNIEVGLRIFAETIMHSLRLTLKRLNGKVCYDQWNPREGAIQSMKKKMMQAWNGKFDWIFKIILSKKEPKAFSTVKTVIQILAKHHFTLLFRLFLDKCRKKNSPYSKILKCASLQLRNVLQKIKTRNLYLALNQLTKKDLNQQKFLKLIGKIFHIKVKRYFRITLKSLRIKKCNSLAKLFFFLSRKEQHEKCVKTFRYFQILRQNPYQRTSVESKTSSEPMACKMFKSRHSLKLSLPTTDTFHYQKINSGLTSPRSVKLPPDSSLSPTKKFEAKEPLQRRNSRVGNIEKAKGPTRSTQRALTIVDKIKICQTQQSLLKLSSIGFQGTEIEKSPMVPLSQNFSGITENLKKIQFFMILEEKVLSHFKYFFNILKEKNSVSSHSLEIAPSMWGQKIFSLGFNKINSMIRRKMRKLFISLIR